MPRPAGAMGTVDELPAPKRVKRSHGTAKGDTVHAKAPVRAAALSGEDDLLLLESGGSSEAALLELQVGGGPRQLLQRAQCTQVLEAAVGVVSHAPAREKASHCSAAPAACRPGSCWQRCAWTTCARTRWMCCWSSCARRCSGCPSARLSPTPPMASVQRSAHRRCA